MINPRIPDGVASPHREGIADRAKDVLRVLEAPNAVQCRGVVPHGA